MLKKVYTNVKKNFKAEVAQWKEYHMGNTIKNSEKRR